MSAKRDKYYPEAEVYADYRELLKRNDIEVVDIATHVDGRVQLMEDAPLHGKHVLSQKTFCLDLADGERLCDPADRQGIKLAVNQMKHLVLFDFAIHWFDMAAVFLGDRKAKKVYASANRFPAQVFAPDSLAQVVADDDGAQVQMTFRAHVSQGEENSTRPTGQRGSIISRGPSLSEQTVTLYSNSGHGPPPLEGSWLDAGFKGAMGELLCAIEEKREPSTSAFFADF